MTSNRNHYIHPNLDRAGPLRSKQAFMQEYFDHPDLQIIPMWRNTNLIIETHHGPALPSIPQHIAIELIEAGSHLVFLGIWDDRPHFSVDISHMDAPPLEEFGSFTDLREVGLLMGAEQGSLAAYARGMSHWHKTHKYCGSCGHKTQNLDSGHRRKCSNIACGRDHFPRTDPAVIMLVTDDDDRALLGRSANFKAHTYSTLAGFVEPGESLEQAVQREVFEEVGINCDNVKYHSSQPWPFPSSLMLGFTAQATSLDINVDPEEIEDARWFTREELIAGEASGKYLRPRKDSISWLLISDWLYAKD